eukprot:2851145-Amphidinium_carterae.1
MDNSLTAEALSVGLCFVISLSQLCLNVAHVLTLHRVLAPQTQMLNPPSKPQKQLDRSSSDLSYPSVLFGQPSHDSPASAFCLKLACTSQA